MNILPQVRTNSGIKVCALVAAGLYAMVCLGPLVPSAAAASETGIRQLLRFVSWTSQQGGMAWEDVLVRLFDYYFLIAFVGSIVGGESVIIPMGILSAQGLAPPVLVFLACYAGVVLSDMIWFAIGRSDRAYTFVKRLKRNTRPGGPPGMAIMSPARLTAGLTASKFLYGFRILSILYFGHKRLSYHSFFMAALAANLAGVGTPFLLSWIAGKGLGRYLDLFDDVRLFLIVAFCFAAVLYTAKTLITKWITKQQRLGN